MCQKGLPKAACKILLLFAITAGLSQMSKPQGIGANRGHRYHPDCDSRAGLLPLVPAEPWGILYSVGRIGRKEKHEAASWRGVLRAG
jgi:hypothetical protein